MTSHLAAPYRRSLSPLAATLINRGLLAHGETHLDYGCGRGGDVERLRSLGYQSTGYDPYYFPGKPWTADVVSMNYVLNVIQDEHERREALLKAWTLTRQRLIVSADTRGSNTDRVSDRGVWTKGYSHLELRAYIETTLGVRSQLLAKDKFLIDRSAPAVQVHSANEVQRIVAEIQSQGFIAPLGCKVEWYGAKTSAYRYWRLRSLVEQLPNAKKHMHLGVAQSEKYNWAIDSIRRRNQIWITKFYCKELSFLDEFNHLNLPILKNWNCGIPGIETDR